MNGILIGKQDEIEGFEDRKSEIPIGTNQLKAKRWQRASVEREEWE